MVRVIGIVGQVQQPLEGGSVGDIVVTLAALFLHHLALDIEFLLRQRGEEVPHPIGLQPEAEREVIRRQRLEVIRPIEERRPVQDAADRLHIAEVLVVADVL